MAESFGNTLRALREKAEVGLSELARRTNISKGYVSDLEHGKVPPPSIEVIESVAAALGADVWELLRAADKEIEYIVNRSPQAADFLRKAKDFGDEDWRKAGQLVEIAGLGTEGKKRK